LEIIKNSILSKKSALQNDVDQILNATDRAKVLVQAVFAFSRQQE